MSVWFLSMGSSLSNVFGDVRRTKRHHCPPPQPQLAKEHPVYLASSVHRLPLSMNRTGLTTQFVRNRASPMWRSLIASCVRLSPSFTSHIPMLVFPSFTGHSLLVCCTALRGRVSHPCFAYPLQQYSGSRFSCRPEVVRQSLRSRSVFLVPVAGLTPFESPRDGRTR